MPERRPTDDELYRVHSVWLGPRGYTLPFKIPYRGLPIGAAVFIVGLILLRLLGLRGPLAAYGGDALLTYLVTAAVLRVTGPERPVSALLATLRHEIGAPRAVSPVRQTAELRPGAVPAISPDDPRPPRPARAAHHHRTKGSRA